jgi:nucleotide-binding universal stress UspA family protein
VEKVIEKILVALDGSPHARLALKFALDVADKYSANLELLTVLHHTCIPYYSDAGGVVTPQFVQECIDAQRTQYKEILSQAREQSIKDHPNLQVITILKEGRPADEIVKTAKEDCVDLIVMGSRGLGGVKQLFLGSVSDRVADEAPCPVLIVKATCHITS